MNKQEIRKAFRIVENVYSRKWNTVRDIVEALNTFNCTILSAEWANKTKKDNPNYYPLKLKELDTWSTHDGTCIDIMFSLHKKSLKIICDAKIYNGESFGGSRTDLRFTAKFYLPIIFIDKIKDLIGYKFEGMATLAYDNKLKNDQKIWETEWKKQMLKA